MSALPPKADIGQAHWDVCFVPKADILRCGIPCRYSITSSAVAKIVGGNREAKCFRGLKIDDQLERSRLHNRQIAWLGAAEDFSNLDADLAIGLGNAGSGPYQTAGIDELTHKIKRWHGVARCQRDELTA